MERCIQDEQQILLHKIHILRSWEHKVGLDDITDHDTLIYESIRIVVEKKLLPVLGRFGIPSAVTSRGTLSQASAKTANMWVRWETGVLREAMFSKMKYMVLDTDYKKNALICSCQDLNIGIFAVNRRSCDALIVS